MASQRTSAISLLSVVALLCLSSLVQCEPNPNNNTNELRSALHELRGRSPLLLHTYQSLQDNLVSALLSLVELFDVRESMESRLPSAPVLVDGLSSEDSSARSNMQLMWDGVIEESCNYVNSKLSDIHENVTSQVPLTFNCTRKAAEDLKVKLEIIKMSGESFKLVESLLCADDEGCN